MDRSKPRRAVPKFHQRSSSLPNLPPVPPLNIHKKHDADDDKELNGWTQPAGHARHASDPATPTSYISRAGAPFFSGMSVPSINSPPSLSFSTTDSNFLEETRRWVSQDQLKSNCIRELYLTERQFAQDMACVVRLYLCNSAGVGLSEAKLQILFNNITEILDISLGLVATLENMIPATILQGKPSRSTFEGATHVGRAMGSFFNPETYGIYESYAHHNQSQMELCFRLAANKKFRPWLDSCHRSAQAYTTAWSLDALLIKPVQRLGKYPLFMKTLLINTAADHPDYPELEHAHRKAKLYLDYINKRFTP